ncbi:MAG: glycosyltransferase, partial [Anaerolineae bacterium]|nr:glycosyltransferase [Anaerolineae bacterium]
MHITVDGVIFEQNPRGGISRIFREVLPRVCVFDDTITVTLLTSILESIQCDGLPKHAHIHHIGLLPPAKLLHRRKFWWVRSQVRKLSQKNFLKKNRNSIWHSTYYTLLEPWDGPVVVTVPDMIYERYNSLFNGQMNDQIRRRKQHSIRRADHIICISDLTKNEVLQYYAIDPDKITVIRLAYNREVFHIQPPATTAKNFIDRPFLLYVGGRTHYKNFSGLLRAYHRWQRQRDIPLVTVGGPWLKQELKLLAELKLT